MSQNFPCYEKGQVITAATTSVSAAALTGTPSRVTAAKDLLLYNPGPNLVHVFACPDASGTADTTCAPLPPGALWTYAKGSNGYLATIAVGGSQNILVILAEGG